MKLIVSIEEVSGGYQLMVERDCEEKSPTPLGQSIALMPRIGQAVAFTPRQCGKRAGEMIQVALEGKK